MNVFFNMRRNSGGASIVKVATGEITLTSGSAYIDITHNLNSQHYIAGIRMKTPIFAQNGCIGGLTHYGIDAFSYNTSGYIASTTAWETRTNYANYSEVMTGYNAQATGQNSNANSCRFYARNASYGFSAGTYEWWAINLDAQPDYSEVRVLDSGTQPLVVTHNLNSTNVLTYVQARVPTYNVYGENAMMNFGDTWLMALKSYASHRAKFSLGYETRNTSAFLDNAQLFVTDNADIQANEIKLYGRGYQYVFNQGTYDVKCFYLPNFT